ncbi:MAG: hypothetical protein ACFFC1_00550 [Promethearchaeota archaeon]
MAQESWNYLINGSYTMLASLFIPICYTSYCCPQTHIFIWIFGLLINLDGIVSTRWFFELKIIPDSLYSWFYWFLPLISTLIIVISSILIIISARKIKQGKEIRKSLIFMLIFIQVAVIIINFGAYNMLVYFGYLTFLFAIILIIIGYKKLPK